MIDDHILASALRERAWLDEPRLGEAWQRASARGESLYRVLSEASLIDEEALVLLVGELFDLPCVSLADFDADPSLLAQFEPELCKRLEMLPIGVDDEEQLYVALRDPFDREAIDQIEGLSEHPVVALLVGPHDLARAQARCFGASVPSEGSSTAPFARHEHRFAMPESVTVAAPAQPAQLPAGARVARARRSATAAPTPAAPAPAASAPAAPSAPMSFDAYYEEAVSALLDKDYAAACRAFAAAAELRPDDGRVSANLARLAQLGFVRE